MKKRIVFANLLLILICVFVGCGKTEGNNGNNKFSVEDKIDYSEVKPLIADSAVVKSLLEQYEMNSVDVKIKDSKNEGDSTKLKVDLILSSEYVSCGVPMIAEISKWNSGWSLDNLYQDGNNQIIFSPIKFPQELIINSTTHHGESLHYSFSLPRTVNNRNKTNLFCNSTSDTEDLRNVSLIIVDHTQDYKSLELKFELDYSYSAFYKSFCVPATAEFDVNKGIWVIDFYMGDYTDYHNSKIELNEEYILENWTCYYSGNYDEIQGVAFKDGKVLLDIAYELYTGKPKYKTVSYHVSKVGANEFIYDVENREYIAEENYGVVLEPDDLSETAYRIDERATLFKTELVYSN